MSRHINKARGALSKQLMKKKETPFEELDLSEFPTKPKWMTRAFRNNRYTVMIDDNARVSTGTAIRAFVQNTANLPIVNHWSEMQRIKNEIFGPEVTAVEYYPAESMLSDMANIYWLWIFPAGVLPMPA